MCIAVGNPDPKSPSDSAVSSGDLSGIVLGEKYRLLEKIGEGAMGTVYKGLHILVDRIVAVKVLHAHLITKDNFLRRFHHEAKIGSRINHPNLVTLWDFGVENERPYLVLEYVEGVTLKDLLAQEGALSIERTASILEQICAGLDSAHNLGIVHRDLKPDNIMLSKSVSGEERVRVLDFGIAKAVNRIPGNESLAMTQSGMMLGTPRYISPEQALERELSARSDIYSLGIIVYEMLSAKVPFDLSSPIETYVAHINLVPQPVRDAVPHLNLPKDISDVVMKALEKEPAARYNSAGMLYGALQNAMRRTERKVIELKKGAPFYPILIGAACLVVAGLLSLAQPNKIAPVAIPASIPPESAPKVEAVIETLPAPLEPQPEQAIQTPAVLPPPAAVPEIASSTEEATVPKVEEPAPVTAATDDAAERKRVISFNPPPAKVSAVSGKSAREAENSARTAKKYLKLKDFEQAGKYYTEALEHHPGLLGARIDLGTCLLKLENFSGAEEQFREAISIEPEYSPAFYGLAAAQARAGKTGESLESLRNAIRLFPGAKLWLKGDSDFESLRSSGALRELEN